MPTRYVNQNNAAIVGAYQLVAASGYTVPTTSTCPVNGGVLFGDHVLSYDSGQAVQGGANAGRYFYFDFNYGPSAAKAMSVVLNLQYNKNLSMSDDFVAVGLFIGGSLAWQELFSTDPVKPPPGYTITDLLTFPAQSTNVACRFICDYYFQQTGMVARLTSKFIWTLC